MDLFFKTKFKKFCNNLAITNNLINILSPGRANIIGEHTDYNSGLALSVAINKYIFLTGAINNTNTVEVYSKYLNKFKRFSLKNLTYDKKDQWINYIKGAVKEYIDHGYTVKSFSIVIDSNLPIGAGLSSSSALILGVSKLVEEMNGINIDKMKRIKFSNSAENNFVGIRCGYLDQITVGLGKADNAIFLNFKNLSYEYIPFKLKDNVLLIVDSKEERNLSNTEYNKRREECNQAVKEIIKLTGYRYIKSLSDVDITLLEDLRNKLSKRLYKRAKHVIYENKRVVEVKKYLRRGMIKEIGPILVKSHQSLRDDYEVSTKKLNFLVDEMINLDGVHGARLMGAGFGGSVISIVKKDKVNDIIDIMSRKFYKEFKEVPDFVKCLPSDGTKRVDGIC